MKPKVVHVDETCKVSLEHRTDGIHAVSQDRLANGENGELRFGVIKYSMGGPYRTEKLAARAVLLIVDPVMMVLYLAGEYPAYFEDSSEED